MNTSMKIHSGILNQYTPRDYPKDTPGEAAARAAGFEAGRQYEASLRDGDNPAMVIGADELARKIATKIIQERSGKVHFTLPEWEKEIVGMIVKP